ncbi:MAG: hypothetical protein FWE35_17240 [Streptosporangiales bacterium]|jgi:hypothetical protein|nr:hypothetical protein [Streptosporangiales bacterium]
MIILRTAGKAIATLVPASQLARLGLPGLWSVEALAVLMLAGVGWIVLDAGRAKNLALILSATRNRSGGSASGDPADRDQSATEVSETL